MGAKLYIKSRYPIGYQPELFFFNHFYFRHNDGAEYILEWNEVSKEIFIDSKGYIYMDITLKELYDGFDCVLLSDINSAFLRNSSITEFSYECYQDNEETIFQPFDMLLLSIECLDGVYITTQQV